MRFCLGRRTSVSDPPFPVLHHARYTNTLVYRAELDYLAVHPDNQGRGIATQLVARGLEEARKIGLDVYVRAFRPGVGLYRRLGFRMEKEFVLDDSGEGGPGEVYRALMTYTV